MKQGPDGTEESAQEGALQARRVERGHKEALEGLLQVGGFPLAHEACHSLGIQLPMAAG
jgi:hypothetical protein